MNRTTATATESAQDAALWLSLLARHFPDLLDDLAPGTGHHRAAPELSAGERAALDARIRAERREAAENARQGLTPTGYSAAPLRLHISDAIRDITDGVVELEEAVRDKLHLGRAKRAPVPGRLARIAALLDDIAAHPVLAAHVRDEARRMARRCARALGDTEAVVRLPGRCPWCDSVSLRAFPARNAVLCVNPACRCADAACGCRDDAAYRHLWNEDDWGALAVTTGTALAEDAARAMREADR